MSLEQTEATQSVPRLRPGRKPKYAVDELERRTRTAAVEAVLTKGVAAGLDAIRIDKVIIDADVPRGATYGLWESRGEGTPQENLRRATAIEIIREMPAGNAQGTRDFAMQLISNNAERLSNPDPADLKRFRSELIREVARFNFELLQSQRWRVYKTLTSSIGTQQDPGLRAAVAEGEETLLRKYGEMFEELAALFSLRLRSEFQMSHFAMSTYALNEGLSNRVGSTFEHQTLERDGDPWTVFAVGFEALVEHYFEASPEN